ncbi:putative translational regulatory protein ArgL [Lelliottia sp. CFBP8978]|uniref:putative translational regulatory protein ArgL n=1 Tax=Lelliottia sp. CFBP8978 TaxID=3096522 RepID=UPI0039C93E40
MVYSASGSLPSSSSSSMIRRVSSRCSSSSSGFAMARSSLKFGRYFYFHTRTCLPPPNVRKIYETGLQVNINTYKVNFNSISGLCHVRIKCLNCIKNTF